MGFFKKLNKGLKKTRDNMSGAINAALYGKNEIDDEFYDELDLPHVDLGDDLGWNLDEGLLDLDFGSQISDDGRPCIVINYNIAPRYDFSKLM